MAVVTARLWCSTPKMVKRERTEFAGPTSFPVAMRRAAISGTELLRNCTVIAKNFGRCLRMVLLLKNGH